MTATNQSRVKLQDLLDLNDEIAGLVRAGLPLDLGLKQLSHTTTGPMDADGGFSILRASTLRGLSVLSRRLSERIAMGASLEQALKDEGDHIPSIYIAVVEAGLKSGRLSDALELVSSLARSLLELHRRVVQALIYPSIVLAFGYTLFVGIVLVFVPVLTDTYVALHLPPNFLARIMGTLHATVSVWGPAVPIGCLALWFIVGQMSKEYSASSLGRLVSSRLHQFSWLPWMPPIIRNFDYAAFTQLLRLLIQHQTPLPESLLLAGHATGNGRLSAAVTRVAQSVQSGTSLSISLQQETQFPPFLRSMLVMGERHNSLDATLAQTSEVYQRRAERYVQMSKVILPIVLTCVVGGGFTLLYAIGLLGPMRELFDQLASPVVER